MKPWGGVGAISESHISPVRTHSEESVVGPPYATFLLSRTPLLYINWQFQTQHDSFSNILKNRVIYKDMATTNEPAFTLYYASHSICSIMVRLTWELRGAPKNGLPDMKVNLQEVDIGDGNEQLTEKFLCEVNKEGFVSGLVYRS